MTSTDNGFFEDVLPNATGYVPIISRDPYGRLTTFKWFEWPTQKLDMAAYIGSISDRDVYFSPMLYAKPPSLSSSTWARKANVTNCVVVTADGDDMDIDGLRIKPTTVVQSSKHHWQAYWRFLDEDTAALSNFDYEDLSHGLYDAHADDGMDRGWPLAVKRRVPYTMNTKPEYGVPWQITYETDYQAAVTAAEFAAEYPPTETVDLSGVGDVPVTEPNDAIEILASVGSPVVNDLFITEPAPGDDWSSKMYQLECLLFEAGKNVEEVYAVMADAACNKFVRDSRPELDCWTQVNRDHARWAAETDTVILEDEEAAALSSEIHVPTAADSTIDGRYWDKVQFLTKDEREQIPDNTFVDLFAMWAQGRSAQSPVEFNTAGACALLSTTLARYAKLPLSFGDMPLNLYFQVLGRTTQSRKSTSLRLARSLMRDMLRGQSDSDGEESQEDEYWLPDDATPEALIDHLNGRPRRSTIYAVDEWQDTLAASNKKGGYLSGLIPFLTKAYDGVIPGVLRKTSATKYQRGVDHYLTFYGTGIFDQAAKALTVEKIESGFVPRTLVVVDGRTGFDPGANDVRFLGEEAERRADGIRRILAAKLLEAIRHWEAQYQERTMVALPYEDVRYPMKCEDDAFARWQQYAYDSTLIAAEHPTNARALFPIMERQSYSVLRVAALLALVERNRTIKMRHVYKAIQLGETWARCAEMLVNEVASSGLARDIREVESYVASHEGAVTYAQLLTRFQSVFDDPRRLKEVLNFCSQKGTLIDTIVNPKTKERVIRYIQR